MAVNTTVGSGLASQIVALDEVTFGVAPTLTTPRTYEFKTETLALKKNIVQGQGLHGASGTLPLYDRTLRRVVTTYTADGQITMDLPGNQLGFWLQAMIGSYGQANATPTQISTSGVYKQIHQPGSLQGDSFCVQKGVPATNGTVEPFTYVGCKVESWTLSVEVNQIAQLALTIDARNELGGANAGNGDPLNVTTPALATPNYTSGMQLFHFREGVLSYGGTPTLTSGVVSLASPTVAGQVKKAEVMHAVGLDKERFFLGSSGFKSEQLENAFRKISGSFDIEFQSAEAMYNAFAADTTTSLELTFTGPIIGTSGTNTLLLDIIIPNVKLEGDSPKIGGPGVVMQAVPWTGLDDQATTQIQFTYQSTDSTL
jgi:tail tube protein